MSCNKTERSDGGNRWWRILIVAWRLREPITDVIRICVRIACLNASCNNTSRWLIQPSALVSYHVNSRCSRSAHRYRRLTHLIVPAISLGGRPIKGSIVTRSGAMYRYGIAAGRLRAMERCAKRSLVYANYRQRMQPARGYAVSGLTCINIRKSRRATL